MGETGEPCVEGAAWVVRFSWGAALATGCFP